MSNTEPIDFIDLTQDSPINQELRLRRNNANINTRQLPRVRRRCRKHLSTTGDIEIHIASESIDLEAISAPEPSGPIIVKDTEEQEAVVMLTCPICLERITSDMKPTSTKCGHIFCETCLKLAIQKQKRCPTCQANVKWSACTRLYF